MLSANANATQDANVNILRVAFAENWFRISIAVYNSCDSSTATVKPPNPGNIVFLSFQRREQKGNLSLAIVTDSDKSYFRSRSFRNTKVNIFFSNIRAYYEYA